MKRVSTIFLKLAIVGMITGVLAFCLLLIPHLWREVSQETLSYAYAIYAVFIAMYVAAVPFFIGCYSAWKLLGHIDKGLTFTVNSVKAVKTIAISAGLVSLVYIVSLPFFYIWGDLDDAPGVIVIGMVLVGAPMVVAVFASLLQKLLSEATELKSENELTV